MQLHSFEQSKSQALEAHAAAFASIKPAGRDAPCNVIAFAQKTLKDGQIVSKMHVIELGGTPGAWQLLLQHMRRCGPMCPA
jgi:clathrin heavy chain